MQRPEPTDIFDHTDYAIVDSGKYLAQLVGSPQVAPAAINLGAAACKTYGAWEIHPLFGVIMGALSVKDVGLKMTADYGVTNVNRPWTEKKSLRLNLENIAVLNAKASRLDTIIGLGIAAMAAYGGQSELRTIAFGIFLSGISRYFIRHRSDEHLPRDYWY